jgi:protein SCO1
VVATASVVAGCGFAIAGCGVPADVTISGYVLDPAPAVGNLSLPDVTAGGAELAFDAAPGGLLVTYFGYTSCPDVCPLTMSNLARALDELGDRADAVDVAMVTVDPNRDTSAVLDRYVTGFIDRAHGLRTSDDSRLRSVADGFGVTYDVEPAGDGRSEQVSHTASVFVVDDAGRVVLVWPFGIGADAMADDLGVLLQGERS